ncbi:helicase-related protein [Acidocella sp.]|uniref:helicase-related protein n=1 Tax=Acidocella sp. TaxID=50710 RepID=UPI00260401A2|nr:helicase-related protein [Acidocella sp.]MDD2796263.1 helicase-related protein [Acidocella sp.]
MSGSYSKVRAVLGPTNTGKTHLAMERLLGHSSGMIGFPLRLLARENYERMVARKGAKHVGLITGEEKIVPPGARWFSCTVEAMPLDRRVEFLAVDEIQLCADPDRGHVFTDRLLHARGLVETMFLGAETIRRLLLRLVPGIEVETRPRLSALSYAGPVKLSRLPPRSAIVAFSAAEVYAIAEAVRRRRGGCAVVMGRLSPRTRNAQVALYQEKEVDFLVATDAIGMGLNMDVDHVAFAGLSKFDGRQPRMLLAAEVAQIAGRAGRGMRDGSFGVTGVCPPLGEELVEAVEAHAFESLEQLAWRNSALDFASVAALLGSLTMPPGVPGLVRGQDAADVLTLEALSHDPEIRKAAQGRAATRLLWEACQIPDFRKLATDAHVKLCAKVFTHLRADKNLPVDWVRGEIEALDKVEGDIDTLMQRLTDVRVWAYITARADWMRDATPWARLAREIEDRISDTLHMKLMARFVDKRAAHLTRRLEDQEAEELQAVVSNHGVVLVEGHEVGRVEGFNFHPDPATQGQEKKFLLRAARRALGQELPRRILRCETAADEAFSLTDDRQVVWEGAKIARLKRSENLLKPEVEIWHSEFLDGLARERLRARISAFVAAEVEKRLGALLVAMKDPPSELRGVMYRLGEASGVMEAENVAQDLRPALKKLGVEAGRFAFFMPAVLKPGSAKLRALLWGVAHERNPPPLPAAGLVSAPMPGNWGADFALSMGWLPAGPVMVRLDVAEKLVREMHYLVRKHPVFLPPNLGSRMGLKPDQLAPVLNALGFRIIPAQVLGEKKYGPAAPAMLARRKMEPKPVAPPPPPPVPVSEDNPFAALAALRQAARR